MATKIKKLKKSTSSKKSKSSQKSNDPWLQPWKLHGAEDAVMPLKAKSGNNKFRLVSGTANGLRYYRVDAKKGAMSKYWKDCTFVPRGNTPPPRELVDGGPVALGPDATPEEIVNRARELIDTINDTCSINTERLECDVTIPEVKFTPAGDAIVVPGRMVFGSLRLFQVPGALGDKALLAVSFSVDGGANPGGNGGGGSEHN